MDEPVVRIRCRRPESLHSILDEREHPIWKVYVLNKRDGRRWVEGHYVQKANALGPNHYPIGDPIPVPFDIKREFAKWMSG